MNYTKKIVSRSPVTANGQFYPALIYQKSLLVTYQNTELLIPKSQD